MYNCLKKRNGTLNNYLLQCVPYYMSQKKKIPTTFRKHTLVFSRQRNLDGRRDRLFLSARNVFHVSTKELIAYKLLGLYWTIKETKGGGFLTIVDFKIYFKISEPDFVFRLLKYIWIIFFIIIIIFCFHNFLPCDPLIKLV